MCRQYHKGQGGCQLFFGIFLNIFLCGQSRSFFQQKAELAGGGGVHGVGGGEGEGGGGGGVGGERRPAGQRERGVGAAQNGADGAGGAVGEIQDEVRPGQADAGDDGDGQRDGVVGHDGQVVAGVGEVEVKLGGADEDGAVGGEASVQGGVGTGIDVALIRGGAVVAKGVIGAGHEGQAAAGTVIDVGGHHLVVVAVLQVGGGLGQDGGRGAAVKVGGQAARGVEGVEQLAGAGRGEGGIHGFAGVAGVEIADVQYPRAGRQGGNHVAADDEGLAVA